MTHYLAGCYLVKQSEKEFALPGRPATRVWTPSECICRLFPSAASLSWTETGDEARDSLRRSLRLSAEEFSRYQS